MEKLIEALQIFLKYDNYTYPTHCEHDTLYVLVEPSVVSSEDLEKLEQLGFVVDGEYDCFRSYRYGSG